MVVRFGDQNNYAVLVGVKFIDETKNVKSTFVLKLFFK